MHAHMAWFSWRWLPSAPRARQTIFGRQSCLRSSGGGMLERDSDACGAGTHTHSPAWLCTPIRRHHVVPLTSGVGAPPGDGVSSLNSRRPHLRTHHHPHDVSGSRSAGPSAPRERERSRPAPVRTRVTTAQQGAGVQDIGEQEPMWAVHMAAESVALDAPWRRLKISLACGAPARKRISLWLRLRRRKSEIGLWPLVYHTLSGIEKKYDLKHSTCGSADSWESGPRPQKYPTVTQ